MSYVLQILENPPDLPLPATIAEAVQILDKLHTQQLAVVNSKFMALAKRLKQRYLDLNSAIPNEDEEIDYNELAWAETIDGDTLDAVWSLGLNTGELFDKARPFVMQEANALGLCVMDEQTGEVCLPGGKVLVMPGQIATAVAPTKPKAGDGKDQSMDDEVSTIAISNKIFEVHT